MLQFSAWEILGDFFFEKNEKETLLEIRRRREKQSLTESSSLTSGRGPPEHPPSTCHAKQDVRAPPTPSFDDQSTPVTRHELTVFLLLDTPGGRQHCPVGVCDARGREPDLAEARSFALNRTDACLATDASQRTLGALRPDFQQT